MSFWDLTGRVGHTTAVNCIVLGCYSLRSSDVLGDVKSCNVILRTVLRGEAFRCVI
jgi:hypothetical protein